MSGMKESVYLSAGALFAGKWRSLAKHVVEVAGVAALGQIANMTSISLVFHLRFAMPWAYARKQLRNLPGFNRQLVINCTAYGLIPRGACCQAAS